MIGEYHSNALPENTNLASVKALRHWQPGQPLPSRNSGVEPNALDALRRHAAAAKMEEQRRRFNSRRQPRTADRKEAA